MSKVRVRWGILGTAQIARKNWKAIQQTGNSVIAAVASRNIQRSRRFIAECQAEAPFAPAPRAVGDYGQLLADPDVDAVYIPLPTGVRKPWVLRAAAAGKHIVCEKPCAASVPDLCEMLAACRRHGVQFMDGVMFMHSRRLGRLRKVLDDGRSVGSARRIGSAFSFCAPPEFFTTDIRTHAALEPLGCLGDLGWYCVRFALWALNWQMPARVTGRMLSEVKRRDSPSAVPTEFSGELLFAEGVSAGFYCSFRTENQQWAHVSGMRGCVYVPDFVLPYAGREVAFEVRQDAFRAQGCDFRMVPGARRLTVAEHDHGHPTAQETNLFRNFARQVRSGTLDEFWPSAALSTQRVVSACLKSARAGGRLVRPA